MRIGSALCLAVVLAAGCGRSDERTVTHFPGMHLPRAGHTQTTLPDGRVLVAGGLQHFRTILPPAVHDIEIFDPASLTFTVTGRLETVRVLHTATLLADGRVVLIGGSPGTSVEIFDPSTGQVTAGGETLEPRMGHTATLLPDGRILVVGGILQTFTGDGNRFNSRYRYLSSIEVYDPSRRSTVPFAAHLGSRRRGHTATLLDDGRVLIVGGGRDRPKQTFTEVVDVAAGTSTWGPGVTVNREDHQTTRLHDGRLLVTGGTDLWGKTLRTAEVLDPGASEFRPAKGEMTCAREDHTATLLPDGRVLLAGGEDNAAGPDNKDVVLDAVEVFDPATETFTKLDPLSVPRDEHHASLIAGGRVLVTGGAGPDENGWATAEILTAP